MEKDGTIASLAMSDFLQGLQTFLRQGRKKCVSS